MKSYQLYRLLILLTFVSMLGSCSRQLNKRITLWRNDKIPYGTYYAYHHLPYLFTDAVIETSDKTPYSFYQENDSAAAYIVIASSVQPDENELNALMNYAMSGNHVFFSAMRFGDNLLDSFNLECTTFSSPYLRDDSMTVSVTDPRDYDSVAFTYPGYKLANYFTSFDSSVTEVIGKDNKGNANYVKFRDQGGGAIYFHLAPAAFTNFFLLHKQNKLYYDLALSRIPETVERVRWDDYFRNHTRGKNNANRSAFSKLGTFLNNEVLRWAFWLTLLLFAIVYLVESKRKQRAIPSIKKLHNSSLDFVKTVGRLYYQRKDNKNLAHKIAAHFLGYIRNRYNLNTSQLDEDFEERLAYKSGYPLAAVKEITGEIRSLDEAIELSDDELLALNEKIDKFINKA